LPAVPDLFIRAKHLFSAAMVDGSALRADGFIADEADRFDATKAGITVRLRNERPSAPALRLLEPHALAAVTNIAWLEEYDPRLLERPLKCLERVLPADR